ncbi:NmrA family NAD(P)-binding protein [Flavitalea antarctica]
MKFVITGSTGNVSKPLSVNLVKNGHEVTIITSNADKILSIEELGAKAAVGTINDIDFLVRSFTGADAVYTMVPPTLSATNWRNHIAGVGGNYAAAIQKSGVKRVVNLSSVGADLPDGTGPVKGLHDVENVLNALEGVSVVHIRAGFFYYNLLSNIGLIKQAGIMGGNYGQHTQIVLVHPVDIANAIADSIQQPFEGKAIRYVASDLRTTDEIAKVIGESIGKPELPWVDFTDEQALDGMLKAGLPAEIASNYVEMGAAIRSGKLFGDFMKNKPKTGGTDLETFAKEFALVYNQ